MKVTSKEIKEVEEDGVKKLLLEIVLEEKGKKQTFQLNDYMNNIDMENEPIIYKYVLKQIKKAVKQYF